MFGRGPQGSMSQSGGIRQENAGPLGSRTGAPTRTILKSVRVAPGNEQTQLCDEGVENRIVTLLAPAVGFTIFVGGQGVNADNGFPLTAGVAMDVTLPGRQGLWAVSNAPVFLQVGVQIAALLIGDTERR
jgi:hypothetical protein